MPDPVLDVGNCDPDHAMISHMLHRHFDIRLDRVMFVDEAIQRMKSQLYKLVMVNRLIFADGSPGLDLVRRVAADSELNRVPITLISNFEEAQKAAIEAGAVRGFGKDSLMAPQTIELLSQYLQRRN